MYMSSGKASQRMLYDNIFGLWGDQLCLLDGRLVTADKNNWHSIMRSHQRIDTRLAHHLPVDAHLPDRARIIRMRKNSAFSANRPMVADKANPFKAGIKSLHHVQRLMPTGNQRCFTCQVLWMKVAHMVMRVVDHKFSGSGL